MICTNDLVSFVRHTCRPVCTNDGKRPKEKSFVQDARTNRCFSFVRFRCKRAE